MHDQIIEKIPAIVSTITSKIQEVDFQKILRRF